MKKNDLIFEAPLMEILEFSEFDVLLFSNASQDKAANTKGNDISTDEILFGI